MRENEFIEICITLDMIMEKIRMICPGAKKYGAKYNSIIIVQPFVPYVFIYAGPVVFKHQIDVWWGLAMSSGRKASFLIYDSSFFLDNNTD